MKGTDPFTINLNNSNPIQFCANPVLIAEHLTFSGAPNIKGIKISFSEGYFPAEDELIYRGKLTSVFSSGTLTLTGSTVIQDYVDAIRSVTFRNNKSVPTIGIRKISVSLDDVDYLPATGHFYRYISRPGISWTTARDEAASDAMMYYGLRGYLATITSLIESEFIKSKTKGVGWIGASDAASEGDWCWVTGPEGLENGGKGLLFWKGTGAQAKADPNNIYFGPVNGAFQNWDSTTPEPNNAGAGGENYGHILYSQNISKSLKWNDFANQGSSDPTSDYYPKGYLIEFGGYAGEPLLKLSVTLDLQVNSLSVNTSPIAPICEGESVTLNQSDNSASPATYLWSSSDPSLTLSSYSIANPVATPKKTTTYTLDAISGGCILKQEFRVPVIADPKVNFSVDSRTCYGYNIDVAYTGNPIPATSKYTWIFGGDTIISGTMLSHVKVPLGTNNLPSSRNLTLIVNQDGCLNQKTVSGILVKPELSPWTVANPIQCQSDIFSFSIPNSDITMKYTWNFGDGETKDGFTVTHKYQNPGKYDIQLTMTNSDNCTNSAIVKKMVFAEPVPIAQFKMEPSVVSNDQPTVKFLNSSIGATSFVWDFGDGTNTSTEVSPFHNFTEIGDHTLRLTAYNDFLCNNTVSKQVVVEFNRIFPPTGFSPNAPNVVDREFKLDAVGVIPQGYHFTVVSRWNDLVFETRDEIKGWDGRMTNGIFSPPGVYIWVLNFTDFLGKKHQQTGSVTLVY